MDPRNDIRVCEMPELRVLDSVLRDMDGRIIDDFGEGLNRWADERFIPARSGMREQFAYYLPECNSFGFYRRIAEDFENDGPYQDIRLKGGLVAVISGERDHLVPRHRELLQWLHHNERYELDSVNGCQRHETLTDWLTPQEIHKRYDFEQQDIIVPIRLKP